MIGWVAAQTTVASPNTCAARSAIEVAVQGRSGAAGRPRDVGQGVPFVRGPADECGPTIARGAVRGPGSVVAR
jgi:hypothetical protein